MIDLKQLIADRAAGGAFRLTPHTETQSHVWYSEHGETIFSIGPIANNEARRFARVADLEAAFIEAVQVLDYISALECMEESSAYRAQEFLAKHKITTETAHASAHLEAMDEVKRAKLEGEWK